ncbi:MAG: dTMP kinase [Fusobacteriota bacterium]
MEKGLFITFEGVEGSGKSTQIKILENNLKKRGFKVEKTREPGGTNISEKIREILLDSENSDMDYMTELLLYYASRAQHIAGKILPNKKEGKIILCDRFTDSTLAYQGYGRGLDKNVINELTTLVVGENKPDITILIDINPEISLKRAKALSLDKTGDRLEKEKIDFHKRVWKGYRNIAKKDEKRFIIINGDQSIEDISRDILKEIEKKLKKK